MGTERLAGISVVGVGRTSAVPDLVLVRVSATAEAGSAAEAMQRASEAMHVMVEAARQAGVDEADRQTRGMNLSGWRERESRPMRYHATQQLMLRLRDVGTAGEIVHGVLAAGGDRAGLERFQLTVDDRTPHLERAREAAMADARSRAEQLAGLAGRTLGPVLAVHEGRTDSGPDARLAGDAVNLSLTESVGPPIEAGEAEIEVRVIVEYAWDD